MTGQRLTKLGFDHELWAAVERYARQFGISRSAFVRQSVREHIGRIGVAERWTEEQWHPDRQFAASPRVPTRRLAGPEFPAEREHQILEMYDLYQAGATLEEIGALYGLGDERVRQLFSRRGLERRRGARDAPVQGV